MENLCLRFSECQWNISIGHYEIEKWPPFHKYQSYGKNSNYQPPKVWVSSFLSVDGNRISALAIMKKLRNGHHFVNIDHMKKFQITDPPPKVWVPGFPSGDRNRICVSHYGKIEKWLPFCKY